MIELTLALAITAVLVTILVPSFEDFRCVAKRKEALVMLDAIYNAIHLYRKDPDIEEWLPTPSLRYLNDQTGLNYPNGKGSYYTCREPWYVGHVSFILYCDGNEEQLGKFLMFFERDFSLLNRVIWETKKACLPKTPWAVYNPM